MNYPGDLKYTSNHEWIRIMGNTGTIGITFFAQKELGDIVYLDVDSVGKTLKKDEVFGTVEAVKTVSDLYLPVSGKVIEFNSELNTSSDLVNKDCYGKGWIVKITIDNPSELNSLLSVEKYKELIGE